ncbi:hypothetical protein Tco_0488404 [Tanacetum coccineum]
MVRYRRQHKGNVYFHSFALLRKRTSIKIESMKNFDQVGSVGMGRIGLEVANGLCYSLRREECNVKTVDDKARYSAFKVTEVKTDEPKALVSVDSMVNWSDHAAENKTGEVEKGKWDDGGLSCLNNGGADVSDSIA